MTSDEMPPLPTHAGRMPWPGLRFGKPGYTAEQMREYAALVAERARTEEREACARVCEEQMDLSEQAKADKRAKEAAARGDEQEELARLKHWSTVSTFNAGLRNAAAAIRARG